jgi:hypothetical protein
LFNKWTRWLDSFKHDAYDLKDETVGTKKLTKGKCVTFKNINKYVDKSRSEDESQAEFYVTKNSKSGTAYVKFYD